MPVEPVLERLAQRLRLAMAGILARRVVPERSGALLVASLDTAQRLDLARTRAFTVRAPSGRRYRIGVGTVANVEAVGEDGEAYYRLCAAPLGLPTPAVMLAQKLMLETREAEFLAIARFTPIGAPAHTAPAREEAASTPAANAQRREALAPANPG
ncbi:MAG TPA: hypothetical protein VFC18_22245 [Burkholderiales bacterium]|nr:hypothetical protein [Burkholderiales bacterium]